MKESLLAVVTIALSASAITSPVIAEENDGKGWYGTAGIGFISPNDPTGDECLTLSGNRYCADYDFGYDAGISGEIGVGYDFGKFRFEATYSRSKTSMDDVSADITENGVDVITLTSKVDDGDTTQNSFMLNAYYDFDTDSKFVPYVGGGIGYTEIDFSSYTVTVEGETLESDEGSDGAFGYQVKAGISYLASEKIDVFGEAIFSGTSGFSISTADIDPITAWGGRVGLRYRF